MSSCSGQCRSSDRETKTGPGRSGEELGEGVQADLGPVLQPVPALDEFLRGQELEFGDHRLAFLHRVGFQLKDVDHAQMDSASGEL